jgi:hypothetical protein
MYALPDIIEAQKYISALLRAYANPTVAEGDGANICLGEAVGKSESERPGTPLEGGYVNGTASDWFAQVN